MCNIWQMKPENELGLDEIRRFAERNSYFKWVQLTGGEPFLRRDIVDIAGAFSENCGPYILSIPTNSLCDSDYVQGKMEEILELPIPRIALTLSLDGYEEVHDRVRGVPGNFRKVLELYQALFPYTLSRSGFELIFGYTITELNQGKLKDTVEAVNSMRPEVSAENFHINVAQTSSNYYHNGGKIKVAKESAINEISWMLTQKKRLSAFTLIECAYLRKLIDFIATGRSPIRNRELDASCYLDSFGNVFPSIMSNKTIGNVRSNDYDLMKMWNNTEAMWLRQLAQENELGQHWTSCEAYQTLLGNLSTL